MDASARQVEPANGQLTFASPADAVQALQQATASKDKTALRRIFGPDYETLETGDPRLDAKNAENFAQAVAQNCHPVPEGDSKVEIEIGTNQWPMPITLIKADGQWHFDSDAGKKEIVARHVGKDELYAIGVCRAYVKAQRRYASMDVGPDSSYALKFKSSPDKRDGLYWPSVAGLPDSPFNKALASAQCDRPGETDGTGPQPYYGYYFRILTSQGPAARGGEKNYMSQGMLSGGFALVAYPEHWGRSGIMTFLINQDGTVFERNLGEKGPQIAREMKDYNPDVDWKPVEEAGIFATSERMESIQP
jgi:hypothetical protein